MARMLAQVEYQHVLPVLTVSELNEAYYRLDNRYNCLQSNYEWFVRADYAPEEEVLRRVEQN